MAAQLPTLRSGLPRRPGGGPWPPTSAVPGAPAATASPAPGAAPVEFVAEVAPPAAEPAVLAPAPDAPAPAASGPAGPSPVPAAAARVDAGAATLRSGLPRVAGGKSWPPAGTQAAMPAVQAPATTVQAASPVHAVQAATPAQPATSTIHQDLRQGLPREQDGQPWPAASQVQLQVQLLMQDAAVPDAAVPGAPVPGPEALAARGEAFPAAPARTEAPAARGGAFPAETKAEAKTAANGEPRAIAAWLRSTLGKGVAAAAVLLLVAGAAVLGARWFLGTDSGQAFLAANPGEYHLPDTAPLGFPAWLGWQHFMNAFLMVLIIRSGLQIRRETRPTAYWTSRRKNATKTSITAWFHQSLDLLWLANGALFMVLLFASGQWMRVVPTSWEVFPNAVSAGLQYLSLDWPTDNGWVNYNSLQQLAYFTTIFVAAPLAAASGFRMSGWWPKQAKRLSALYPIEMARKIHVPVMVYFVVFIAIHVILVMTTGALRNLNHMYAAQGSVDPAAYAENWFGFWMFVLSLAIIGGALAASRPLVLAPLASVFGKVSSR